MYTKHRRLSFFFFLVNQDIVVFQNVCKSLDMEEVFFCLFQAECDELGQRAEVLSEENASLRAEINRLKSQCEELTSENTSLKVENKKRKLRNLVLRAFNQTNSNY